MKIGIRGGVGPIRMGVSTKGAGVGLGPLSVGGSWGRGGAGLLSLIAPIAGILLLVFWPYMLGEWVAGQFGADEQSTARDIVGWLFEALYIGGIAWLLVHRVRASQRTQARAAELARQRAHEQELRDAVEASLEAGRLRTAMHDSPTGVVGDHVAKGHRLLWQQGGANLIEPRSAYRGGPKVPTVVDHGMVFVTDKAVQFRSDSKRVEWRYDRMLDANRGKDFITFHVSNRQLVSGVGSSIARWQSLILAIRWGMRIQDRADVERVLADVQAHRETCADRLASLNVGRATSPTAS